MPASTPDPTRWLADLMATQQTFMQSLGAAVPPGLASGAAPDDPSKLLMPWQHAAQAMTDWQQRAMQQMTALWSEPVTTGADAPAPDRRFAADSWRKDPRFSALAQAYLGQAEQLRKALDAAPLDERGKGQWGFLLRQVVDAASPANCLATNPEAMQMAIDSGGASLLEGMRLFTQDLARGRVSMTDDTAFEVGRNVATTPGSVVFENDLFQLVQYTPTTAKVHERPLLIVPPCINKYYIMDLQPENSLVRYVLEQGHTVFLVSWKNPGKAEERITWDDYLQMGPLTALDVVRNVTGVDKPNVLGFCVGGTLLTSALAVARARGEEPVESLTLMTTLLDFGEPGELGCLIDEAGCAAREASIGKGGLFKGQDLANVFSALRANDLIWQYVVGNYLKGKTPMAFDLLYWNSDPTNLAGPFMTWYLRNMYLENNLRVPGRLKMLGIKVDLGKVDVPAYLFAAREDHIVPWKSAYMARPLLGGETTFVLGASGHIAGAINPVSKNKRSYWTSDSTVSDPEEWLSSATEHKGSWWANWIEWVKPRSGEQIAARGRLGNKHYAPIEPAPGRYVKERA